MKRLLEVIELHNELNPLIWENKKLKIDVESKLLDIVNYFIEYCETPLEVVDVQIVGSNASFNYNKYSDLDVHLMVNFDLINISDEALKLLYNKEKTAFNKSFDITIHGIHVELYIQDMNSSTMSNGIYSLYRKTWIKFPKPINVDINYNFDEIVSKWNDRKTFAIESNDSNEIKKLINTAYLIRTNSLQTEGEFSKGNLLFKELRNSGILDELKNSLIELDSKNLSLESFKKIPLTEASRNSLLTKSKTSDKGRQRYKRRVKSKVANQVKQFNSINMDKLFKEDILTINVSVKGETDDYIVKISFGGFLEILRKQLNGSENIDLRVVTRALLDGFNKDDVYIHCSCPDFKYRFHYWATKNNFNSGEPQNDNGKWIRNPDDRLGSGCKHILLVLSNNSWLIKVASVIRNYINYMKKYYQQQYADIIYPAIYGKKYEEPVQTSIFDDDELISDEDTLDISNELGRTSGQFKKGNDKGIRFTSKNKELDDQQSIEI